MSLDFFHACDRVSMDWVYIVLEVVPKDLDIVHVPKGGLSDVGHPEAGQGSLQPDQEKETAKASSRDLLTRRRR